ncbi:hypothetical protein ACFQFC_28010 [Amorphoplanes digitatis]|uniref:Uncharacterized protein n=1 Tax=Actinoplanes digitatis TaxID=1868 RepID=A0A7W7HSH2_9ACTN|nr:hypothetical protein [Actinoplanes digitatis]MBB4759991.1 hypothetical protein [Actinoplanes digitatis]GID95839.1 hypothetical protein Adi01nite_52510 [Actinoplanes digitatis]
MQTVSARRELGIVVALAVLGLGLVLIVAFAPWYAPAGARDAGATVVQTYEPQPGAALGR